MNEQVAANRAYWDELAHIHQQRSAYYDIDAFRAGGLSLRPLERAEVGDVSGKSLLHLQCHFGMDTLSWARLGARVTGVDFSPVAIERARALATECGIDARFVCADLDSIDTVGDGFDIAFTSFGTIVWLPDLDRWARLIARSLAPGGMFYLLDGHPLAYVFDAELRVAASYFRTEPEHCPPGYGDYAVKDAYIASPSFEWNHTIGDIVTALATAGLRIEFVHEFDFAGWQEKPMMKLGDDGYYRFPPGTPALPAMLSIKATR